MREITCTPIFSHFFSHSEFFVVCGGSLVPGHKKKPQSHCGVCVGWLVNPLYFPFWGAGRGNLSPHHAYIPKKRKIWPQAAQCSPPQPLAHIARSVSLGDPGGGAWVGSAVNSRSASSTNSENAVTYIGGLWTRGEIRSHGFYGRGRNPVFGKGSLCELVGF